MRTEILYFDTLDGMLVEVPGDSAYAAFHMGQLQGTLQRTGGVLRTEDVIGVFDARFKNDDSRLKFKSIMPIDLGTDILEWYCRFMTYAPFKTGNKMIGKLIFAAVMFERRKGFQIPDDTEHLGNSPMIKNLQDIDEVTHACSRVLRAVRADGQYGIRFGTMDNFHRYGTVIGIRCRDSDALPDEILFTDEQSVRRGLEIMRRRETDSDYPEIALIFWQDVDSYRDKKT